MRLLISNICPNVSKYHEKKENINNCKSAGHDRQTFLGCFFGVLCKCAAWLMDYRTVTLSLSDRLCLDHAEFGLACHLGVLSGLPCVGVAKNLLQVQGVHKNEEHQSQVTATASSINNYSAAAVCH